MLIYIHKAIKTKKGKQPTMESTKNTVEPVTLSEVLSLATWDRPRTNEELRDFISKRESMLGL